MDTKICTVCKKELLKNTDNYFLSKKKQLTANNTIKYYYVFKSLCKKCHGIKRNTLRVKKRCEDMQCSVADYRTNWKKQFSKTKTIHPEYLPLNRKTRVEIAKLVTMGYIFTTYEQYRLDCRKKQSVRMRKYDYGDVDFVTSKLRGRYRIDNLPDCYIATSLKKSVKEVPKTILESRRLIIQLKRELKINNIN
jgi:hypothetical protein